MSGRAGRRGKDDRGICVIMIDEKVKDLQSYVATIFVFLHKY
jgi:superfamily II RNA helicase